MRVSKLRSEHGRDMPEARGGTVTRSCWPPHLPHLSAELPLNEAEQLGAWRDLTKNLSSLPTRKRWV